MTPSTPGARQQRYVAFQEFLNSANARFKALGDLNPAAKRFDEIYSLCITPGGRHGGANQRQLEVFFGSRPYEAQEYLDSSAHRAIKVLSEQGATLEFVRDDLGRVHVYLYPAASEGMKPQEDAIELDTVSDTAKLAQDATLAHYFRLLVAYMQCTCLEGLPTRRDRFTVAMLRFFCHRSIDGRLDGPRFSVALREIAKWGFTVGLSGTLLAVVQWNYFQGTPALVQVSAEPSSTQQQRAVLVNQGKESGKRLEAIEWSLRDIRARLDEPLIGQPVPNPPQRKSTHGITGAATSAMKRGDASAGK
jgi:hypothetical protein